MAQKRKNEIALSRDNWIEKSNPLNEIRNTRMTPTQQRLFYIYLSKINPRMYEETREVTFKLEDYTKIMQFKQMNTTRLVKSAEDLLGLTVKYFDKDGTLNPDGNKGLIISQLFKRFRLYKNDEDGVWYVSINCHDDAKNLMFDLKQYFKYQLWNVLPLSSTNQQRMYELLKQYERSGVRVVSVDDLREWLWMKPEEYSLWQNFKVRVLDASKEALARYTDIKFTWEVAEKKGKGGKVSKIRFFIAKNENPVRQLMFEDFLLEQGIGEHDEVLEEFERKAVAEGSTEEYLEEVDVQIEDEGDVGDEIISTKFREMIEFLRGACHDEFSYQEVVVLYSDIRNALPSDIYRNELHCFDFLSEMYNEMLMRSERTNIQYRHGYLRRMIGKYNEL